jgi:hypothetical protein
LPIHVVREINVYLRAARQLAQKLDHEPSVEEIAVLLDKPIGEVERMLGLNERIASMDMPYGKEADRPLLDTIPDENVLDPAEPIKNVRRISLETRYGVEEIAVLFDKPIDRKIRELGETEGLGCGRKPLRHEFSHIHEAFTCQTIPHDSLSSSTICSASRW